ncbi:response regulator [bacterium]|nr:response regulator [bacterium]
MKIKKLNTILYAEDEEDIRSIAQIALEDIGGFDVRYCTDGLDVLETVKNFIPDLLLLDVMMPKMDGRTTLLELRKIPKFSLTPVIFMTAKIQENEMNEYKLLGAIDVIAKPFDPMTLADKINTAWAHYHG